MQLADRAQQVLLACARFDSDGRLMVTHEGLLPCQKITIQENQRVSRILKDDLYVFSRSHSPSTTPSLPPTPLSSRSSEQHIAGQALIDGPPLCVATYNP